MRRPIRRPTVRAALNAAAIPEFSARPASSESPHWLRSPGRLPAGRRLYVIGDIHGQRDKVTTLHARIAGDRVARPVGSSQVIHLGDYINQGPDSAGVIAVLAALPGCINLIGDHERMLLQALDGDRAAATDFLWSGGKAALESWGLDPALPRENWGAALPAAHVAWLRGLVPMHQEGTYLFVHAGIRPGIQPDHQSQDDLLTIRQPFLSTEQDFGVIVVHGHAAEPAAFIGANRIGIDTGAGFGGKLTCAVLEDDLIGLIAV
jgi:serine/threonine protein phosphatase 1